MGRIRMLDWRAVAYAAVVAASLAFGAKEALAAGVSSRGATERSCSSLCQSECGILGGHHLPSGRCICCFEDVGP